MQLRQIALMLTMILTGSALSYLSALWAVGAIEAISKRQVEHRFAEDDITWATVETDGLEVFIVGTARSEADRFYAITSASKIVDASRVIDQIAIVDAATLAPPAYGLELLRNQSGLTIVGLIPTSLEREKLLSRLSDAVGGETIHTLLDQADHPTSEAWQDALDFGIRSIATFPRAKVSIRANHVFLQASAASDQQREKGIRALRSLIPEGVNVQFNVDAPRPVISPFTLRAVLDDTGLRFDTCSAPDEALSAQLIAAAQAYDLSEDSFCNVGLGMPLDTWPKAALAAIEALGKMKEGAVTILDTEISLFADQRVSEETFEKTVQFLKSKLPTTMELNAEHKIKKAPVQNSAPLILNITIPHEGQAVISGPLASALERDMARSFALAAFGQNGFGFDITIVPDVPKDWAPRVLAAIKAAGHLQYGNVDVSLADLKISGQSKLEDPAQTLAQIIQSTVGSSVAYDLSVERIIPEIIEVKLLSGEECVQGIVDAQKGRKINFETGSARVNAAARGILDDIAEVLKTCEKSMSLQINGYTDSQGRPEMNEALSQKRAETVLRELRIRRVVTQNFKATGFGEDNPIADNATKEGREANRRIEFTYQKPQQTPSTPTGDDDG